MARKFKEFTEEVKKATGDLKDTCWKGYTAVGMKMKNGRKVPNCVPVKEEVINEDDLPVTDKKSKTVTVKHKTSGKELNVVDTPSVREKYKKMDYHPVKEEIEQIEEAEKIQKHRPGWMARMIKRDNPEMAAKMNQGKEMNKLMHKYGGKTSDEIAKMKKEEIEQVDEQHREKGRFKPVKPHNVPETPGAMMKKEETQLDEISHETKAAYTLKAKQQVKELEPHAKKGEYKDLAKNLIAKRKKGLEMAKESVDVPFEGGKPAKGTVTDKSGAKHTPMSRVKDLARKALEKQKQAMKPVKESESESRKKEIVKDAAKNASKKTKDKFDPDPELSSEIMKENK